MMFNDLMRASDEAKSRGVPEPGKTEGCKTNESGTVFDRDRFNKIFGGLIRKGIIVESTPPDKPVQFPLNHDEEMMSENTIRGFSRCGRTTKQVMDACYVIARAMPDDLVKALEAEVKYRSSLAYRIKTYLPWCKEFFLSR